jgi:TolB-like protein/class 3 adenylate cyclase
VKLAYVPDAVDFRRQGGGTAMAPRAERKLAAVLAADVVGYSRLMSVDENGTHARLKALRKEFIEPRIAEHHGRVVKLTGDGALVEFASAVDAIECAALVQQGIAERNAGIADDEQIRFRIGINIGDIILEDGDIYGDGVNVAARLETLAEPGGICIARNVYNQVKNKVAFGFEPQGEHQVKNIPEPVTVYRVIIDPGPLAKTLGLKRAGTPRWRLAAFAAAGAVMVLALGAGGGWYALWPPPSSPPSLQATAGGAADEKPALPLPDKPSIAVLPFENLSGDPKQERLAGGITEDIITDLSRFRDFFVIVRNSTEVYKGKPIDVRQVARELGVQYVLEGSLQAENDRVRITAQLIDATTGNHVWSERYDRPLDDLFAVQDEVTRLIAASIGGYGGAVARAGQQATRKPPHNVRAYDYYLLAAEHRQRITKEGNEQSRQLSQEAIKVDPGFARAYIGLAQTHHDEIDFVWTTSRQVSMDNWHRAIQKAISLDPSDSEAHLSLAIYYSYENEFDRSLVQLEEAVELNPNNADVLSKAGGNLLPWLGRPEEGVELVERAKRLNPHHPNWYYNQQRNAYFFARQFEKAIAASKSKRDPETPYGLIILAMSYAQLGRHGEAAAAAAEAVQQYPDYSAERELSDGGGFARETELNLFLDGNRKAGLPICATEAQLAKYPDMKRLPACEAERAKS